MNSTPGFKFVKILFIFLLFYIFLFGIGSYELFSKDEPRYSGCALEMIENNDFIVPKFNFQDRFDKPVLFYWLIAAAYKIFGVSSFSSRLPSALSAIFLVLFTWYTGKKVFGKTTGFISALILASCIEYVALGRRAATDMVLCMFFTGSLYSMYLGYHIKDWKVKIFWTIVSGIFAGFGILTKGPVCIVLQLTILTLFLIFRKQFDIKHLKVYFLISFVALIVSLPWYVLVHFATGGEFTKVFFLTHNLERFTSVVGEHPGPFWFYIPVLLLGFMPWTFFFIPSCFFLIKNFRKKRFNKFILFCLTWAIIVFVFFSSCKTKMFTYLLPIFPAVSLITGYWITLFTSKKCHLLLSSFTIAVVIPGILILSTAMAFYHKRTYSDLADFARLAKQSGAKEIISYGGYKPILVYYGRVPVDFNEKPKQIKKIKELLKNKNEVYIIGYLSDLKKDKPIIVKNKELFKRLEMVRKGRKYFLGRFV